MVVLVFGVFEDFYCCCCDFDVFWYFSLYGDDFCGKNQLFWLFGRDDDFVVE